jgi:uncharacterized protein YuzE
MTIRKGMINIKGQVLQQINIDPLGGCLYLQFSNEKVARTQEHTDFINLDLDKKGELVGIEFVGVKKFKAGLKQCFIELAKKYKRPELRQVPIELKKDLALLSC